MTFNLQLSEPAWLYLTLPSNSTEVKVDVYEARRFLFEEAIKKPNESERWKTVREWLANKFSVDVDQIAESDALEFNNAIARIVEKTAEQRSKKLEGMLCSQLPTQVSPTTSESGS